MILCQNHSIWRHVDILGSKNYNRESCLNLFENFCSRTCQIKSPVVKFSDFMCSTVDRWRQNCRESRVPHVSAVKAVSPLVGRSFTESLGTFQLKIMAVKVFVSFGCRAFRLRVFGSRGSPGWCHPHLWQDARPPRLSRPGVGSVRRRRAPPRCRRMPAVRDSEASDTRSAARRGPAAQHKRDKTVKVFLRDLFGAEPPKTRLRGKTVILLHPGP
jgi:hypothetical protein